jgi:6-phosphogluconolactonase (cycloisomerase 2 family)
MKIARLACLALTMTLCLSGCTGFWDAPVSPNPPTTLTSGFFYVLNFAKTEIAGFYVNKGVVTAVPGSPYTLAAAPIAITVAPSNAFLYVSTVSGIYMYTIATSTGQLTLGNNSQVISADQAASMQVDSTNSWLVEGFTGSSVLNAIHIDPSTGLLASTTQEPVKLSNNPVTFQQVAISPDNNNAYAAMGSGGTAVIQFNAGNTNPFGSVVTIPSKSAAGGAVSVAVDPITSSTTVPRLLYIGETAASSGNNTGGLRAFNYTSLQEISGSPFAVNGLSPSAILPFSTGNFVYVLNRQVSGSSTGVITGFTVAASNSTYSLTPLGNTFSVGTNPQSMVEDSTHAFVLAVNFGGSPDLTGYTIDATKAGYLDTVISSATGTSPVSATAIAALH